MAKDIIFSKIGKNDYNNQLEKILEKKAFTEDVKNLLLSMLYKIENAYEDYRQIKRIVVSKKEFIEELFEAVEECNQIKFVKPYSEESEELKGKNFEILEKNIKVYQNDRMLLEALLKMGQRRVSLPEGVMKEPLEEFFEIAFRQNKVEVIRDFNGWSWDIAEKEIENIPYHVAFQNIVILEESFFGILEKLQREPKEEIGKLVNNILTSKNIEENTEDYVQKLKEGLKSRYGMKRASIFIKRWLQFVMMEYANKNQAYHEQLQKNYQKCKMNYKQIANKEQFLKKCTEEKKDLNIQIERIEELQSNKILLQEEYQKRNQKLPNKQKYFSANFLKEELEKDKKKAIERMYEIDKELTPGGYQKLLEETKEKFEFYEQMELERPKEEASKNRLEELQEIFLMCFEEKIQQLETKREIIEAIYHLRYYRQFTITLDKVKNKRQLVEEKLIKKACEEKVLIKLSEDMELNTNVLKNIFCSKMVCLEEMNFLLKYQRDVLIIEIYDGSIQEATTTYQVRRRTEINVKLKKKIKIFS